METRRGMRRALIKRNAPSLPSYLSILSQRKHIAQRFVSDHSAFTQIFLTFFFCLIVTIVGWLDCFLSLRPFGASWTRFPAGIRRNLKFAMLGRARAIGNLSPRVNNARNICSSLSRGDFRANLPGEPLDKRFAVDQRRFAVGCNCRARVLLLELSFRRMDVSMIEMRTLVNKPWILMHLWKI